MGWKAGQRQEHLEGVVIVPIRLEGQAHGEMPRTLRPTCEVHPTPVPMVGGGVGPCRLGMMAGRGAHRCSRTAANGGSFAIAVARQAMCPATSWMRSGQRTPTWSR